MQEISVINLHGTATVTMMKNCCPNIAKFPLTSLNQDFIPWLQGTVEKQTKPLHQTSVKGNPGTTSSGNAVHTDKWEGHLWYPAFLSDASSSPPFPIVPTILQDRFCLKPTLHFHMQSLTSVRHWAMRKTVFGYETPDLNFIEPGNKPERNEVLLDRSRFL